MSLHLLSLRRALAGIGAAAVLALPLPSVAGPADPRFSVVEPLLVGCPSGNEVPGCDRPLGSVAGFSRLTDTAGNVTFAPRVGGSAAGSTVVVDANGVVLAEVAARSTDFDGDGRTDLQDVALLVEHLLAGSHDARTDLDGCSAGSPTTLRDFAILGEEFLRVIPDPLCP